MEEKKVLVVVGVEEKVVGVLGVGVGGEEGGVNLFDFLVMFGLLNVCFILLYFVVVCLWWG